MNSPRYFKILYWMIKIAPISIQTVKPSLFKKQNTDLMSAKLLEINDEGYGNHLLIKGKGKRLLK